MGDECVIVACHDRLDDLSVQLEIQRLVAPKASVVVVHTGQGPLPSGARDGEVLLSAIGFKEGPVAALIAGLAWASENGFVKCVYRNADDWMMSPEFHASSSAVVGGGVKAAGYCWLSRGGLDDLAFNELWLDVGTFSPISGRLREIVTGENFCEVAAGKWVKEAVGEAAFHRLQGREAWPPIGILDRDISMLGNINGDGLTGMFWRARESNTRFFCRSWQLIGSHDNAERLSYWKSLREAVAIAGALEAGPAFQRWLRHAQAGLPWNGKEPCKAPERPQVGVRLAMPISLTMANAVRRS